MEGGTPAQEAATLNTRPGRCYLQVDFRSTDGAAVVAEKLRANVARNGGFIALPPAHHIFFGMDPLPGVVKVQCPCALPLTMEGHGHPCAQHSNWRAGRPARARRRAVRLSFERPYGACD